MKESLQNVGDLIAEPSGTFERLKSSPRSGIAISVLADVEKNRARVAAVVLWIISILPEVVFAT